MSEAEFATTRMGVCKGCQERYIGCHGKNEDGGWKCKRWGEEQERKASQQRDLQIRREMELYKEGSIRARERKVKAHHA